MVGRTKPATKTEKARMDKIAQMRCAACFPKGPVCGKTEVHHLVNPNRRGHMYTVPLGRWHHRGIPITGLTTREMRFAFGPSLRLESKRFREMFGSDDELLAKVNRILCEEVA